MSNRPLENSQTASWWRTSWAANTLYAEMLINCIFNQINGAFHNYLSLYMYSILVIIIKLGNSAESSAESKKLFSCNNFFTFVVSITFYVYHFLCDCRWWKSTVQVWSATMQYRKYIIFHWLWNKSSREFSCISLVGYKFMVNQKVGKLQSCVPSLYTFYTINNYLK